jgi:hypothetical protein
MSAVAGMSADGAFPNAAMPKYIEYCCEEFGATHANKWHVPPRTYQLEDLKPLLQQYS